MRISVIVPIYNSEKYLKECIDSILNQTYFNLEIVLVDDGSTDRSTDIIDRLYKGQPRVVVVKKENGGLISARREGLRIASGDYVCFVDSDDYIEANLIDNLTMPIIREGDIDVSIAPYVYLRSSGKSERLFKPGAEEKLNANEACVRMFQGSQYNWTACGRLYKRTIAIKLIDDWWSDNPYGEDTEWNWRFLQKSQSVYYQPYEGYYYRENELSMMHEQYSPKRMVYVERLNRIYDQADNADSRLRYVIAYRLIQYCVDNIIGNLQMINGSEETVLNLQTLIRRVISENEIETGDNLICSEELINSTIYKYALSDFQKAREEINQFTQKIIESYNEVKKKCDRVFIYGAGKIGKEISAALVGNGAVIDGVVVSFLREGSGKQDGLTIYEFKKVDNMYGKEAGYLIAANRKNSKEIIKLLDEENLCYSEVGQYTLHY